MMNLCGLALFTLLLPRTARRSIHLDLVFHDAQQQSNTLAETLEALLPGGFRTALFHGWGPPTRTSQLRPKHLEPHLAVPTLRVGPRRATVVLHAASGAEEDQLPPKEDSRGGDELQRRAAPPASAKARSAEVEAPRERRTHVVAVESTPNPSAFLLRLSEPLEGVSSVGLRGMTYRRRDLSRCPPSLAAVLANDDVESVFVANELVTISKRPSAAWESLLPQVIEALGCSDTALRLTTQTGGSAGAFFGGAASPAGATRGVTIRLQVSQKLPIQVEASGWSGDVPPVRAKLSARFGNAMGLLMGQSDDSAFFQGRVWLERGLRYPECLEEAGDLLPQEGGGTTTGAATELERNAIAAALEAEVAEVEAAYPDERLAAIVFGQAGGAAEGERRVLAGAEGRLLSLEDVDQLCDEDAEAEARGDDGLNGALKQLAAFVAGGRGLTAARRNAIAYLGGTTGRGGEEVFSAIRSAFESEKAAGIRRTAGDALSDLGDERAVPSAAGALADRSPLVRWRAARILGELGEGAAVRAALKQAALEEARFEVAFEIKDAIRKVELRDRGEEGGARGPMWKQIQEGVQ